MLDSQEFQGTRVAQWGVILDVKTHFKGSGTGAADQCIKVGKPTIRWLVLDNHVGVVRVGTQVVYQCLRNVAAEWKPGIPRDKSKKVIYVTAELRTHRLEFRAEVADEIRNR